MVRKKYDFQATEATREAVLLRIGICGPTGAGKTETSMRIAARMVERLKLGTFYVIDSEHKSALRYAYSPRSGKGYRFKHVPMPVDDFSPEAYIAALEYCESQGAGLVVIDSFSHVWNGINGVLEQVDKVTAQSRSRNQFSEGWKTMTPVHNRFIQRIMQSGAHLIFTLRAKTDWQVQENERGKKEPVKVGLAPIAREGIDYEPDLFFDMTAPDNTLSVAKSRCDRLAPGEVVRKPGNDFADVIIDWLLDAETPIGARTMGEALNEAVTAQIAASRASDPEAFKAARVKFLAWCERNGVDRERIPGALQQLADRVAAVLGAQTATNAATAQPAPRDWSGVSDAYIGRLREASDAQTAFGVLVAFAKPETHNGQRPPEDALDRVRRAACEHMASVVNGQVDIDKFLAPVQKRISPTETEWHNQIGVALKARLEAVTDQERMRAIDEGRA